jgi:DtxR family Mn-dependent transcriptional regulator
LQIGRLSQALEDYLETIFRVQQSRPVARVRDIASSKGVRTSSVISALKRLAKEGLVRYQAREYVELTEEGRRLGFRLYQRHTFLKRFLTDVLQVQPEIAEEDACTMEHAISAETLDRVAALSEFLSYCRDVDPELLHHFRDRWLRHLVSGGEAARCGERKGGDEKRARQLEEKVVPLTGLGRGEGGYVARIADSDGLRRELIARGVLPGNSLAVREALEDGRYRVAVAGESMDLAREEAEAIRVWPRGLWDGDGEGEEAGRTLADMTPGRSFRVRRISAEGEIRQRLVDMGFVRGAEGRILREALLRDPIEVEMKGSLLSLRRVEATGIQVEELNV